jgi:hypothetical protein
LQQALCALVETDRRAGVFAGQRRAQQLAARQRRRPRELGAQALDLAGSR